MPVRMASDSERLVSLGRLQRSSLGSGTIEIWTGLQPPSPLERRVVDAALGLEPSLKQLEDAILNSEEGRQLTAKVVAGLVEAMETGSSTVVLNWPAQE